MKSIGSSLQKKRVLVLLTCVLLNSGCDNRLDQPVSYPEEGKNVSVTFPIGLASETDGYQFPVSTDTKTFPQHSKAVDIQLIPTLPTRAVSYQPDSLYRLEIRQYSKDGNTCLGGKDPEDHPIGEPFSATLKEASDCQLVFVAWGKGSSLKLGTGNLSSAQNVSIEPSNIENLRPDNQEDMNKMPYVLHLKNVNVTSSGIVTNPTGEDIRVLLKRLASRIVLDWSYTVTDYSLQQILLQSVPLNYKAIADPNEKENNTYPSLLDQFTTLKIPDPTKGTYSCWIPANVRGGNANATSPIYRIKSNAPIGSSYISFIAVNKSDPKKKLNYRIYLGGQEASDFNLYPNWEYHYKIGFSHTVLPTNDRRVTIIDPIPASENNRNFVPTANCFMVAPGGSFCFDPFMFRQSGKDIENTTMTGWGAKISKVRLLWQTLENGDVGDPAIGVVNSESDHSNIVDIKNTVPGTENSEFTKENGARIYCRVAPNTSGGSGLIAAYDASGAILWSWHIWVTDYHPSSSGDYSVDEPNKRKQKYTYGNHANQYPIMDRNLGAMAGYTSVPPSELEKSKTHGFHYQWGRKDPFPSCYTSEDIPSINVSDLSEPIRNILNFYQPDGVTYCPREIKDARATFHEAYQDPTTIYKAQGNLQANLSWNSVLADVKNAWGGDNDKTFNDPCPAGWRVTKVENYYPLFKNENYNGSAKSLLNLANSNLTNDGGVVVRFDPNDESRTTYIRFTGYWYLSDQYSFIGKKTILWNRNDVKSEGGTNGAKYLDINSSESGNATIPATGHLREVIPLRCIQELP